MFSFAAYLFDIDGTLVNSRDGVHYYAFHSALRQIYEVDCRIDNIPVHGNTDIGILRAATRLEGVSDFDFQKKLPAALDHMRAQVARNCEHMHPELCPSVVELASALRKAGKLLGVVSGNLEAIGWAKLERAGLRSYFDFGAFSDGTELRQEIFRHGVAEARRRLANPQATVCLLGDTPADILAAQKIGTPVIALGTGLYPAHELQQYGPTACFDCCTSLLASIAKL